MRNKFTLTSGFFTPRLLLASGFFLGAISLAVIAGTAGSPAAWTIVPSPNVTTQSFQYSSTYARGLACASASECWSVGSFSPYGYGSPGTFIGRWDGSSWSVADSPTLDSYYPSLNGVTCASASDCWAVGSYLSPETSSNQILVEHWDGAAWTVVSSPNTSTTQNNSLFGVTCVSEKDCWAVGRFDNGTLTEHWDGASWTIVTSPSVGGSFYNYLNDVTCVSGSDCWAAGQYFDSSFPPGYKTLLEHWDGAAWTIVKSPNGNPSKFTDSYLNGVTCTSSSDCWSVGYSQDMVHGGYGSLVEHWNGSSWSVVTTSAVTAPVLHHVTCASASDCWIVGTTAGHTLAEHWNGKTWSVVSSPDGDSTQFNELDGVVCVAGGNCWAAGQYSDYQKGVEQTLMEHWNGASWSVVPSANPYSATTVPEPNQLAGAACASDTDCWAVGFVRDAGYSTLIQHWDGNGWTIVDSPNTTDWLNQLNGVTCNSWADCWAVGIRNGIPSTLIEHWDGATWSVIPSPNIAAPINVLYNVSCPSASQCWAVGYAGATGGNGPYIPLIERWNGAAWTIVPTPSLPSAALSLLNGVSCPSATDCWAVGSFRDFSTQDDHTLIEQWNGTSWTKVPSPDPGKWPHLTGVSCTSASDCWAAGYYYNGAANEMFFEHWDGTAWSVVSRTSSSSSDQYLSNITCASASQCWAIGYQNFNNGTRRSLIANWDGNSWVETPSPAANAEEHLLSGVACSSESQCWGVGYYSSTRTPQTLIQQYSLPMTPGYTISVNPLPTADGTVGGGGRYAPGSDVTVTAVADSGFHFNDWTESGLIVSTSSSYAFTAASNRRLVANFVPLASPPTISPNGGTFTKKVIVKMSSATIGATIYYTTDGTDPTTSSSIYPSARKNKKSKGITLTGTGPHTVKAMSGKSGYANSSIAVAEFIIN